MRKAGEVFNMLATFAEDQGKCKCACCEYRQYVRGSFKLNGQIVLHPLPSGFLSPVEFKEDGVAGVAYGPHFGHRDEIGAPDDLYLPTRQDGCEYQGNDFPGMAGRPGNTFDIELEYRGEIIDVCNSNVVLQSTTWRVKFSGRF